MVDIRSVGMGERQSEDSFVCFDNARFPTRPEEDEERQGPRAVNRGELTTVRKKQMVRERQLLK